MAGCFDIVLILWSILDRFRSHRLGYEVIVESCLQSAYRFEIVKTDSSNHEVQFMLARSGGPRYSDDLRSHFLYPVTDRHEVDTAIFSLSSWFAIVILDRLTQAPKMQVKY